MRRRAGCLFCQSPNIAKGILRTFRFLLQLIKIRTIVILIIHVKLNVGGKSNFPVEYLILQKLFLRFPQATDSILSFSSKMFKCS